MIRPQRVEGAAAAFGRGPVLTLRAANYEARLAPSAGGRLASLDWVGPGGPQPLVVPWDGQPFEAHFWPKAGAFPMIPFANRLTPEGFSFRGRQVQPQHGPQGFPLHGLAHRRVWQVVAAGEDFAYLRLAHLPDADWPWAFTASQSICLSAHGILLELAVRNDSAETMPLSIGWHPYHPIDESFAAEGLLICAKARHELDPQGRATEVTSSSVFGSDTGETVAFSGWDGNMRLQTVAAGSITVACKGSSRVVFHAPATGRYVCVEPVTQLPGRLGEASATSGTEPSRTGALPSGATSSLSWHCAWQPS